MLLNQYILWEPIPMELCREELSESTSIDDQKAVTVDVETVSKEKIRPASPTPFHLRTYKISLLDQLSPAVYNPFVFFYPDNETNALTDVFHQRSQHLKQSLSETLTRFYPFAGRIEHDLHVECNDEGVLYVQARVNEQLSNFLSKPNNQHIHKLLPYDLSSTDSISEPYVAMIQVNFFNCGGIAISICTSHKIIDGHSHATFLQAWAATARGSSEQVNPRFIGQSLFPQNPLLPKGSSLILWPLQLKQGKCFARRFVFNAPALAALKAKTASPSAGVQNPSRVMAVTSLLWKCGMNTSRATHGFQKPSFMTLAVNLRTRCSPPMPRHSIGNNFWLATARCKPNTEVVLHSLAEPLKDELSRINSHLVEQMKGEEGFLKVSERLKEMGEVYSNPEADYFVVTSVCNASFYEADFGWGKPIWSCIGHAPVLANVTILMDTKSGDGVEAWVTLTEEDMAVFERDPELLTFASLDPSPLETAA
ncbi:hypothetical protein RJ640_019366 [Escallonia rubra]|uniref:Uncharacterized protein n=1 Tax=Escallonia rubra TaxID=112253 RepID=A0AA88SHQ4_9ASTE|nr:hypothetical protein RJ640_019366 [Escallonia rubra]